MGDTAVSEQKVVETSAIKSSENKEESKAESSSTSTKKSKPRTQSRGKARAKLIRENEEKEVNHFKENIYIVFVECETPGNIGFLARTMANFGLKNLILINPPKLTNEAYYQATHGKYIVENAKVYNTLDDFYQSQRIDFKVASTGMAGGSYNLARIPIKPEELGKSFKKHDLFINNHKIVLQNGIEIKSLNEWNNVITEQLDKIYSTPEIGKALQDLKKKLTGNDSVRTLREIILSNKEILVYFKDVEKLKKILWVNYLNNLEKDFSVYF